MAAFPETWWRARPLIFAHRGACRAAPENTLAAFRAALDVGADGVELDVHLSSDGVPVVIHNAKVDATTDGTGWVSDLTLAQLKQLDAGSHFDVRFAGERIPTLEEVLVGVGGRLLVNIELKDQDNRAEHLESSVVEVVQRVGMPARVWFSSFKPHALMQARQHAPDIPCALLYGPLGWAGRLLLPLTPHEALHPHLSMVSEASVRRAHERGLRVAAWTVDRMDLARTFADWGVDVLITNEPETLRALWP